MKKGFILPLVAILLVSLTTFGVIAYVKFKPSLFNKAFEGAEQASKETKPLELRMSDLTTMNVEGEIILSEQIQVIDHGTDKYENSTNNFSLKLNQDVDFTDPKVFKSSGKFESRYFSRFVPADFFILGENITVGKTDYFKFTKFSDPAPFLTYTVPSIPKDLTGVETTWIEIDDLMWYRLTNGNAFWGLSLIPENQPMTINTVRNLFLESTLNRELSKETINNQEFSHYIINLKRESVESLLREVFYIQDPETYRRKKADKELEKMIKDFLDGFEERKAEVWIGQNNRIYKTKLDLSTVKTEDPQLTEDSASWIKGIALDLNFSKFDSPMTINSPTVAKKFEELPTFSDYWSFEDESSKRDYIRYVNLDQIAEELNLYAKKNGKYPELDSVPTQLGDLDPIPTDPGGGPCSGSYQWIPNKGRSGQFLIYACLEDGKYYIFNEQGGSSVDQRPMSLYVKPPGL